MIAGPMAENQVLDVERMKQLKCDIRQVVVYSDRPVVISMRILTSVSGK